MLGRRKETRGKDNRIWRGCEGVERWGGAGRERSGPVDGAIRVLQAKPPRGEIYPIDDVQKQGKVEGVDQSAGNVLNQGRGRRK